MIFPPERLREQEICGFCQQEWVDTTNNARTNFHNYRVIIKFIRDAALMLKLQQEVVPRSPWAWNMALGPEHVGKNHRKSTDSSFFPNENGDFLAHYIRPFSATQSWSIRAGVAAITCGGRSLSRFRATNEWPVVDTFWRNIFTSRWWIWWIVSLVEKIQDLTPGRSFFPAESPFFPWHPVVITDREVQTPSCVESQGIGLADWRQLGEDDPFWIGEYNNPGNAAHTLW